MIKRKLTVVLLVPRLAARRKTSHRGDRLDKALSYHRYAVVYFGAAHDVPSDGNPNPGLRASLIQNSQLVVCPYRGDDGSKNRSAHTMQP